MKKVILRLIVVAIALALIVLILLNTVFKPTNTKRAYDSLNTSLSTNGEITLLSNNIGEILQDLKQNYTGTEAEFNENYGNMYYVYLGELNTLQNSYIKLFYLNGSNSPEMENVSQNVDSLSTSIKEANKSITELLELRERNSLLNLKQYLDNIKPKINQSLECVVALNASINNFLVGSYYENVYSEEVFYNIIKTYLAKDYLTEKDVFNDYKNLNNNGLNFGEDTEKVGKITDLYNAFQVIKDIDVYSVMFDYTNYCNKLDNNGKEKVNKVAKVIESIARYDIKGFNIN